MRMPLDVQIRLDTAAVLTRLADEADDGTVLGGIAAATYRDQAERVTVEAFTRAGIEVGS